MADMTDPPDGRLMQRHEGAGAVHPITEELEIGAFHPAPRPTACMSFKDGQAGHQPVRQGRPAGIIIIDRTEPAFQKTPVDRPCQLPQRTVHGEDLVEPGRSVWPLSRRSRTHHRPSRRFDATTESLPESRSICWKTLSTDTKPGKSRYFPNTETLHPSRDCEFLMDDWWRTSSRRQTYTPQRTQL